MVIFGTWMQCGTPNNGAFTRWARGLARAKGLEASSSMLDRPAIAYYVGAQKGDPLAVLAFSRLGQEISGEVLVGELSGLSTEPGGYRPIF